MDGRRECPANVLIGKGRRLWSFLQEFAADETAATAIEYGLIVGGIAIAIVAVVFNLGEELENVFQTFLTTFQSSAGSG